MPTQARPLPHRHTYTYAHAHTGTPMPTLARPLHTGTAQRPVCYAGTPTPTQAHLHLPRHTYPGTPTPTQAHLHLPRHTCTYPGTPTQAHLPRHTYPGTPTQAHLRRHIYIYPRTPAPTQAHLHLPRHTYTYAHAHTGTPQRPVCYGVLKGPWMPLVTELVTAYLYASSHPLHPTEQQTKECKGMSQRRVGITLVQRRACAIHLYHTRVQYTCALYTCKICIHTLYSMYSHTSTIH